MNEKIIRQFEADRPYLRAVAYRMLGSTGDADDAVQEAWLRLSRADASAVENLRAWLTTIVARVSLDMLRSRQSRREDPPDEQVLAAVPDAEKTPRSRTGTAFGRFNWAGASGGAGKIVALRALGVRAARYVRCAVQRHRAHRRLFTCPPRVNSPVARVAACAAPRRSDDTDFARRRAVAEAFLQASRDGDFAGLLAVLDPDVVNRVDAFSAPPHGLEMRGATKVAKAASSFSQRNPWRGLALVNGEIGVIVAPRGRLQIALLLTISDDKISAMQIISDPARLAQLDVQVLAEAARAKERTHENQRNESRRLIFIFVKPKSGMTKIEKLRSIVLDCRTERRN